MTIIVYGSPAPQFGRLTVIEEAGFHVTPNGSKFRLVLCLCSCGEKKVVRWTELNRKDSPTRSCGCLKREVLKTLKPPVNLIHGRATRGSKDPLYRCWEHIKQRCLNAKHPWFHAYGGRGILMWDGWRDNPAAFISYVEENLGERPNGYSIDRKDNEGDYRPGNLRWASPTEQNLNTRRNRRILAFGRSRTLSEWANETGIGGMTINGRIKRGWNPEQALTIPATLSKPNIKRRHA